MLRGGDGGRGGSCGCGRGAGPATGATAARGGLERVGDLLELVAVEVALVRHLPEPLVQVGHLETDDHTLSMAYVGHRMWNNISIIAKTDLLPMPVKSA